MRTTWIILSCLSLGGCYTGATGDRVPWFDGTERAFPLREPDDVAQGWFLAATRYQELSYEVVDGVAVHEGDIVLGRVVDFDAVALGQRAPDRSAVKPDRLWTDAVVPYVFDDGLPQSIRDEVGKAIEHWHQHTRLRFVPRSGESDYVRIQPGDGCSSNVGRLGGEQGVWLSSGCGVGSIIHELGHTAGLWHEQSRADRDANVTIDWANIAPGFEHNFLTYLEQGTEGADIGSYDVGSIMHYPSWAFAIDADRPTITTPDGGWIEGQRERLSDGDLGGVAHLYGAMQGAFDPTCYVTGLYRDVLGREPDAGGLVSWVGAIEGGVGASSVADGFVRSEEARVSFVVDRYESLLRREPDAAGLDGWVKAMLGGLDEDTMTIGFLASPEYWESIAGSDGHDLVAQLYQDVLGRAGSEAEIKGWLGASLAGVKTRRNVVTAFVTSDERRALAIADTYRQVLDREPDPDGAAAWLDAMRDGSSIESVRVAFLSSPEYLSRCPSK